MISPLRRITKGSREEPMASSSGKVDLEAGGSTEPLPPPSLQYRILRFFFETILNIFFRDIEVVGLENIPPRGGAIIAGNHFNQFVDAMILLVSCPRTVSFLAAEKSMKRPVIGWFGRAMHAIPVVRPQDSAITGTGMISVQNDVVTGTGTKFTVEGEEGGSIMIPSVDMPCRIKKLVSDTEIQLGEAIDHPVDNAKYKLLKKVDQKQLYDSVYNCLATDGCIGIFPEGGSHDRTELLPLKAGIAVMSLGFVDKYHTDAVIVPCGMTYFEGHRFRSQVVIEFGAPIKITPDSEFVQSYANDRRAAYNRLLDLTKKGLESVTVTAPSYEDLCAVHLARRLYQSATNRNMKPAQRASLTRMLAAALKEDETQDEMQQLKKRLLDFNATLTKYGLKQGQLKDFTENYCVAFFYFIYRLIMIIIISVLALPGCVLNAPIFFLARYLSFKEMKLAKATSNVKIKGKDVVASYKLMVGIVVTPIVYLLYMIAGFILVHFLMEPSWKWVLPIAGFFALPFFTFATIKISEKGYMMARSLLPLFVMLNPCAKDRRRELLNMQDTLEKQVVEAVRKIESGGATSDPEEYDIHLDI